MADERGYVVKVPGHRNMYVNPKTFKNGTYAPFVWDQTNEIHSVFKHEAEAIAKTLGEGYTLVEVGQMRLE